MSRVLGIDKVFSELADKVSRLEDSLAFSSGARERLAFIGDGINDMHRCRADVGIAMGAGL